MRSIKIILATSTLVCAIATSAFAQDAAPEGAAPEPAAEPAPAAAPAPAEASASVSTSEGAPSGKFVIGARLGYGIAMGDSQKDAKLSDGVSGHVPIWLDLGYMVTPNIMLGLYGQYGIGIVGSSMSDICDTPNIDCSVSVIRLGIQGQYHLSPAEKFDPWFGLGFGYEWNTLSVSGNGGSGTFGAHGFEFANLQGGFDYKLSPAFGIGPFLSFSLGQYGTTSAGGDLKDLYQDGSIDNTAIHEWLTFGIRGAFTL
jgi:outer membrane protein W